MLQSSYFCVSLTELVSPWRQVYMFSLRFQSTPQMNKYEIWMLRTMEGLLYSYKQLAYPKFKYLFSTLLPPSGEAPLPWE